MSQSAIMNDIVVVPTISLNPKKAKKKLKKAARACEQVEEPRLPVNDPVFGNGPIALLAQPAEQPIALLAQRANERAPTKHSPADQRRARNGATARSEAPVQSWTRSTSQQVREKSPETAMPVVTAFKTCLAKAPASPASTRAPSPSPSAASSEDAPEVSVKRSWFDITEDDDDNFLSFVPSCR